MKNDWDDYSDEFDDYYEIENTWEVRVDDDVLEVFENKEDAIWFILDGFDSSSNNKFFQSVGLIGYNDEEELFKSMIDMCSEDFYSQLEIICENFDIEEKYRLVNLDNEEPEFGEL